MAEPALDSPPALDAGRVARWGYLVLALGATAFALWGALAPVSGAVIAPGVIKDHLTLGFTYNVSKDSELTMAYMHAFKNSVSGDSLFNKWVGGTAQDKIEMYQNSLGIAYGLKF